MIKFIKNLFIKPVAKPEPLAPLKPENTPFPIVFSEIEDRLKKALQAKLIDTPIPNEDGFTLIKGFMPLDVHKEISNNLIIGGSNVPTIGLVGGTSGRIYLFALKAVLTDLEF